MSDFRKKLLDKVTHALGFEAPQTVEFAKCCEQFAGEEWADVRLETVAKLLIGETA